MKLSDLLTINQSVSGQLNNAEVKILAAVKNLNDEIATLKQQLSDVDLSDDQAASVNAVVAAAEAIDNIIPDPVPVPPAS